MVAIWILSAALYYAAATGTNEAAAAEALHALVQARYRLLIRGAGHDEVFKARIDCPEELQNYARALSQLPYPLVEKAFEMVLSTLDSAIAS